MRASVHLADVTIGRALSLQRRRPDPATTPGLRSARIGLATPLRDRVLVLPVSTRIALITFWDDDAAIDAFEATPAAADFMSGWHARMEVLRAYGSWPGLDADVSRKRHVDYDGPALVFTLGRLRFSQAIRFLRASYGAERAANAADGMLWGTAIARPPFVATCSLWRDSDAIAAYAFDAPGGAHPHAIDSSVRKAFHHEQAFVRGRPYAISGQLGGRNPLPATALA
jgi:hypothetical protein